MVRPAGLTIVPPSGSSRPASIFSRVVLPAPFGPASPTRSRSSICQLTESRSTRSPKAFVRETSWITGVAGRERLTLAHGFFRTDGRKTLAASHRVRTTTWCHMESYRRMSLNALATCEAVPKMIEARCAPQPWRSSPQRSCGCPQDPHGSLPHPTRLRRPSMPGPRCPPVRPSRSRATSSTSTSRTLNVPRWRPWTSWQESARTPARKWC